MRLYAPGIDIIINIIVPSGMYLLIPAHCLLRFMEYYRSFGHVFVNSCSLFTQVHGKIISLLVSVSTLGITVSSRYS